MVLFFYQKHKKGVRINERKRANETGSIYAEDIKDLQNRQNEIWEIAKEILARQATIQ